MAMENAGKLVQMIREDENLKRRLEGMTPEEVLAFARESGLDVTAAELREAVKTQELLPEEMDGVAGGGILKSQDPDRNDVCPRSPNGEHKWQLTGHEEVPHKFLWIDYTVGYDHKKCSLCGKTLTEHV